LNKPGGDESWLGYIDCTDADQSYLHDDNGKKLFTDDKMIPGDGAFAIGANSIDLNKIRKGPQQYQGLIDWIIWKDTADPAP